MNEILLVLLSTAVACVPLGCILVLRELSMLSDAISHTVLLGIVIAFLMTRNLNSPLLIIGATVFGFITVFAIEALSSGGMVKRPDAVGIIFPLFFSIAIILITKYARNSQVSTDIVLMGDVLLTPFKRFNIGDATIAMSIIKMLSIAIINFIFFILFYKELKLGSFDPAYATVSGFSGAILFYTLMGLTSLTGVLAFNAVGAILVISFFITPAASAYIITKSLKNMLIVATIYAIINSIIGFILSFILNVNTSGMVSVVAGITFLLTIIFNKKGVIQEITHRQKLRKNAPLITILIHIYKHSDDDDRIKELGINSIHEHLNWSKEKTEKCIKALLSENKIKINNTENIYSLTDKGKTFIEKYIV